jgi:hypothetical protein
MMSTIDTTIDTTLLTEVFDSVWNQYGGEIAHKTLKTTWEGLSWAERARLYGEKVQRLYGTMQVLGQLRPVSLEGVYTAVHLLDKPTAELRSTLDELIREFAGQPRPYFHASQKEKRRDGLEMVSEGKNLFILGKPGAGKTTFLKHVALQAVTGELGRVPIFVSLNQLSRSDRTVFDYIVDEFDVCEFPDAAAYLHQLLKCGRAILLFDGLDEVNETGDVRKQLIDGIEAFIRKYGYCQHLITCRVAANKYAFTNFTYVEMADFDANQIQKFVAQWFGGESEQQKSFLSELEKSESEGLLELARVPLLLALLCLAFESTSRLSQRRVELYKDALNALLSDWDDAHNIKRDELLSKESKRQMLAEVAAKTFKDSQYFIREETLARSFEGFLLRLDPPQAADGEIVLRVIIAHHGLLLERAHRLYSFAHLTFHEYFAAQYYADRAPHGLAGLIQHFTESRWYEVFLLTAAQLQDAQEFFELFLEQLATEARERPAVAALLRWAASKASTASRQGMDGAAARSLYIFLALALTYSRARVQERESAHIIQDNDCYDRNVMKQEKNLAETIRYALYDLSKDCVDTRRDGFYWLDRASALDPDLNQDRNTFHPLDRGQAVARALAVDLNLDKVITRTHARALVRAWGRILARVRVHADGFEQASTHSRERERAWNHLRTLARDRQQRLQKTLADVRMRDLHLSGDLRANPCTSAACDMALVNAWLSVSFIVEFQDRPEQSKALAGVKDLVTVAATHSGALGRTDIQQRLATLAGEMTAPVADLNCEHLASIANDLHAIMADDCCMIFPDLNETDRETLVLYLDGNLLLLECLKQAIVSDRAAIEDRLLLLPEE